ncbi:LuxR C-terminal-related transcriptional regulator [Sphingoaurantiacus capsulatus]|uniref:LuxR C-terminal-related transcriptional regulator n=1 Tax=Sphingoaurantiacus capsulatus TaxID=1771310 RepID=A0ABV7XCP6_9SPHN
MDDLKDVAVDSVDDIARAATAFRDAVARMAAYRLIISDNIATARPMRDASGEALGATVFAKAAPHDRWWCRSQLALKSPLAQGARYESEPFWANADGFRTLHPNAYLDAIDLSDFAARNLLLAGIVVPVHMPFGQLGMATFGSIDPRWTDLSNNFARDADRLMLLTRRFLTTYAQVTRRREWLPPDCRLTGREIQCLRLAAAGKKDHEIARIIARSHTTIRFHLHNAGEKLNAVSRGQMVFKAGQLGYLAPLN